MSDEKPPFEGWAILELMGHRRLGGYVAEATVAGAGFLRIDVPGADGPEATQFYSPSSVYCLTPTTEAMARAVAVRSRLEPVQRWELPAAPDAVEAKDECVSCGDDLVEDERRLCGNCAEEPF